MKKEKNGKKTARHPHKKAINNPKQNAVFLLSNPKIASKPVPQDASLNALANKTQMLIRAKMLVANVRTIFPLLDFFI